MKKQFFFGMVAAAALCGCSNNEVEQFQTNEQNAIQFGVYVGQSVNGRAAVIDLNGLQTGTNSSTNGSESVTQGFGVFACYTGQDKFTNAASKAPNFMFNEEVTYNASKWGYTTIKYWPNNTDDKVSFFAYAPYNGANIEVKTGESKTPLTASATGSNMDNASELIFTVNHIVTDQEDLLVAHVMDQSKRKRGSSSSAANESNITTTDSVTFAFEHALARIGFTAEVDVDAAAGTSSAAIENGTTITIDKIELLGNFHADGIVDLTDGTITGGSTYQDPLATPSGSSLPSDEASIAGPGFELTAANNLRNYTFSGSIISTNALNKTDSYIMIIPQNFAGSEDSNKFRIRVTYTVKTTDTQLGSGNSSIQNTITSDDLTQNFQKGKAYTFNLRLGMTSVKVKASETAWDTLTDRNDNQNLPANTTN